MDPEFAHINEELVQHGAQARPAFVAETLEEMTQAEVATAAAHTGDETRRQVVEAFGGRFADVPAQDRRSLYLTVIWMLGALAVIALGGATAALLGGEESAAFFTFAGLALGGLTGLLAQSPLQE